MAKTGGVFTFLMIGFMVLAFLLGLVAQNQPVVAIIVLVLYLVAFVMWFVVMVAIKVNCGQNGYTRAGGPVVMIMILTVGIIAAGIVAAVALGTRFGTAGAPPTDPQTVIRAIGVWGVIIGVIALLLQIAFLILGARLNEYGSTASGVWKGAGILLIISASVGLLIMVLYLAAALTEAWGILIVAGILGFINLVLWLVFYILVGIGFMGDAGRMAAAGPAAVQRR